jgi:transcriptional regulator with XRE-family HTH domain
MLNITELRQKKGLSITDLANALGVAESTVYRWENGETTPRLGQVSKLQEALDLSEAEFLAFIKHLQVKAS